MPVLPLDQAVPAGVALASSDPLDSATLVTNTVPEPVEFFFTGANQIQLVKDQVYCFTFEVQQGAIGNDNYRFGYDWSVLPAPQHPACMQITTAFGGRNRLTI